VEEPLPLEEVATPDAPTIEAVAKVLGVPTARTAKAVFYEAGGKLVFVTIRGDVMVNESKLAELLRVKELRPAGEELIRASGAEPGYASPVGLSNVIVVVDRSAQAPNLVAGANRAGYHLRNVNVGRDYQATHVADIAVVEAGAPCPVCGTPLAETRGIEVGNIFKLETMYSGPLGATYLDENDQERPMIMGSYGFGVSRVLAAIAEHHRDERGLRWPVTVAPFEAHLVVLGANEDARRLADDVHVRLEEAGIETLYDDRDESAGVKFADADLIGVPVRLTVSSRSIASGGVEIKRRDQGPELAATLAVDDTVATVRAALDALRAERAPA
jgi:prolyl-tRNA synthetase